MKCKYFLFWIFSFSALIALAQDPESINMMAGKIDVQDYELNLHLNGLDKNLIGSAIIHLKCLQTLNSISFNLEEMNITQVLVNNKSIKYNYADNSLKILNRKKWKINEALHVSIKYHGQPKNGLIISKNKFGDYTAFADNWASAARNWFPCIDHPSDKATVHFKIYIPKELDAIANGIGQYTFIDSLRKEYKFSMDQPIATYCMVIGIADFAITKIKSNLAFPIYYYNYPEDSLEANIRFSRVPDMVLFFDSLIGPYPYSSLSLVESTTVFGGMENSSAIFLSENSAGYGGSRDADALLSHELVHQWFGDAVTQYDWADLWLSEGFATYLSMVYFESRDGKEKFNTILANTRSNYLKRSDKKHPIVYNAYEKLSQLLNNENYAKAGLFLHRLRLACGDTAFFEALRKYYSEYKHKNANTQAFKKILEECSQKDLTLLFDLWLHRPGLPD